ncbi:RNAse II-like 1 isoform X2 [Tasmannia lanceolata]|uniref:RNAse II-like 1 isoform X2 n=1 Tax=Tasmannia lanceolata TaxID=3420 RepID=UPI0040627D34
MAKELFNKYPNLFILKPAAPIICRFVFTLSYDEPMDVAGVEEILGYQFRDPKLLEEALTHSSFYYPMKPLISYERLEFIGDAVLNFLMAREFFDSYPELSPGPLTRLRAANVDTEKLARVAVNHGLHRYVRHKVPALNVQMEDFMEAILEYPIHSNGLIDAPKFLADIVEALLGAVSVDSGHSHDTVWKVFRRLLEPVISLETLGKHPMSELYELCQKNRMRLRFVREPWEKNTTVEVFVDEHLMGSATSSQKKEIAQNRAAKMALDNLKGILLGTSQSFNTKEDILLGTSQSFNT